MTGVQYCGLEGALHFRTKRAAQLATATAKFDAEARVSQFDIFLNMSYQPISNRNLAGRRHKPLVGLGDPGENQPFMCSQRLVTIWGQFNQGAPGTAGPIERLIRQLVVLGDYFPALRAIVVVKQKYPYSLRQIVMSIEIW